MVKTRRTTARVRAVVLVIVEDLMAQHKRVYFASNGNCMKTRDALPCAAARPMAAGKTGAGMHGVAIMAMTGQRRSLKRRYAGSKGKKSEDDSATAGCVCRMRLERSVVCAAIADPLLPVNMVAFLIANYGSNLHQMQKIIASCTHHCTEMLCIDIAARKTGSRAGRLRINRACVARNDWCQFYCCLSCSMCGGDCSA